ISYGTGKERCMRVTEKLVNSPEEEGVTLEYIRLTNDFEEIKEYVQHKGEALIGYTQTNERVSVRVEDILYFETVDGIVFVYTMDSVYEVKGRLYQVEEKVSRKTICRASKAMLVNVEYITSVRTALNGRLYAKMENGEEILITRRYAKEIEDCFMEDDDDERI
ncbi:LytTR family DNA-binding domain-containing protein, partial [Butyribacter sp.]|uniref:LytTR family DNA-binding domain-containing protein n=1 Tax=Butyribacter sp. TaxID=2822465 RepID=UPI002A9DF9F9|nr:LytTR family DNA-binding domain-containing protein [Butyribacter sp.]